MTKTNKYNKYLHLMLILVFKYFLYFFITFIAYKTFLDSTAFNGSEIFKYYRYFINEITTLFLFGLIIYIIIKRYIFSLFITVFLYYSFLLISLEKIKYLNSPLLPFDVLYIKQVLLTWSVFKTFIPGLIIFTIVLAVSFYYIPKFERKTPFLQKHRYPINVLLALFFISIIVQKANIEKYYKKDLRLMHGRAHPVKSSETRGLLYVFMINTLFQGSDMKPLDYSKKKINGILKSRNIAKLKINKNRKKPSLIVYLIESFIDVNQLGLKTTRDPIPFFHSLQKKHKGGEVYSPVVGGRSANAEFELLTGFSFQFFHPSSIPYIDLPTRKIPSLANELFNEGYSTSVVQAVNLGYFNYRQMYNNLNFIDVRTLNGKKNIRLDIANRYPSDNEIVNEIINISKDKEDFFIFAFPNSTHGSWNYEGYDNSSLDIVLEDQFTFDVGRKQIKIFLNALHTADLAIEKLITYFEKEERDVVILIVGDHQPGMPELREQYMFNNFSRKFNLKSRLRLKRQFERIDVLDPLSTYNVMHKVPYAIWTNFSYNKNTNKYQKGMNSLILTIFDIMGITPKSKFYIFLQKYSKLNSFESLLKFLHYDKSLNSQQENDWNNDFKNIQYDLLYGNEYLNFEDGLID